MLRAEDHVCIQKECGLSVRFMIEKTGREVSRPVFFFMEL